MVFNTTFPGRDRQMGPLLAISEDYTQAVMTLKRRLRAL